MLRQFYGFIGAILLCSVAHAEPTHFSQAKVILKDIYQGYERTFYCDCAITWVGRSGGVVDHQSCGYHVYSPTGSPSNATLARAARSEVEHIIPISWVGKQLQCWQHGGRKNCQANDALFNKIEADLFNLTYAVGQVNGLRADLPFGMVSQELPAQFGRCDIKIDTKSRKVQPRAAIRGDIARVAFYMADRYNLALSKQDQQLFMAWHRHDPVSAEELTKHQRTATITGRSNPFVTGEKQWTIGFVTSGVGLAPNAAAAVVVATSRHGSDKPIYANRQSRIYHRADCPNYTSMAPANREVFSSAAQAEQQGYRLAANCPQLVN